MRRIVKGIITSLLAVLVSGCASYIASEITSVKPSVVSGNSSDFTEEKRVCDGRSNCVNTVTIKKTDTVFAKLTFVYKLHDNHQIWRYEAGDNSQVRPGTLTDQLIVLFAAYNQPARIFFIQQLWLQQMTGADVIVVPSANASEQFKFGLDYTAPIIQEIKRRNPEKVHLVGFSMGALAAQSVAQEIDNSRLYLVAPMTDFEYSTKAIWNNLYRGEYYTRFVSMDNVEDAIQLIYDDSHTTPDDTDLLRMLQHTRVPTFIYASSEDRVVDASSLQTAESDNVRVNIYEQLNHIEMIALLSQTVLNDFVSDILERRVANHEAATTGILCQADDIECLGRDKIIKKGE